MTDEQQAVDPGLTGLAGQPGPTNPTDPPAEPLTPDQVVLPFEQRFMVGLREIVIRPLVIGEFERIETEVGAVAQEVAIKHPEIDLAKPDQHLAVIIPILGRVIGRILERLTGVEEVYLKEHLTVLQVSEIVVALLEVNQVPAVLKNVGRARQLMHSGNLVPIPT